MNYKAGERADCHQCKQEILFNGSIWQHTNKRSHMAIPQSPKTITVRIAVHIDLDGNWNAAGWGNGPGQGELPGTSEDAMMEVCENGGGEGEIYWVTAELEIPEIPEIPEVKVSEIDRTQWRKYAD